MVCEIRSFIGTRKRQEDAAACCETEKGLFAAVCDGVGSRSSGGESARLAADRFVQLFREEFAENYPAFIVDACARIDREAYEKYGSGSGTTAVTVYVCGESLYWLSVGDSRLYILRGGKLTQITKDHDYGYVLGERLRRGLIGEETYRAELTKCSILASYVGMGGIDIVDVSRKPFLLRQGDVLLLTTDGLYKSIGDGRIAAVLNENRDPVRAADRLLEEVRGFGRSLDNTTYAIIGYGMEE